MWDIHTLASLFVLTLSLLFCHSRLFTLYADKQALQEGSGQVQEIYVQGDTGQEHQLAKLENKH